MKFRYCLGTLLSCLILVNSSCLAQYNAALLSASITNGTSVTPRSVFTQTWTFTNNGTITWAAGGNGCTLDLTNEDSLGVVTLVTNTQANGNPYHFPRAALNGGKSVAANGVGSYSIEFIAPETTGSYTDYFQLNGT